MHRVHRFTHSQNAKERFLRVESEKLEGLTEIIGELAVVTGIIRTMLDDLTSRSDFAVAF